MEKRIYYHDTDAGGVVYYGNYLKYMEEARTEFLEQKGLSILEFRQRGLEYAVRRCSIVYRSPARYGDVLICDASLKKITPAQLIFEQKILHKESGRLIAEGEVSLACITTDFKPAQIPEEFKNLLV